MKASIKDYINNVLREKRDEFGGMAVCPFAGPELDSNKLMIDVIGDKNLEQLMMEFVLMNNAGAGEDHQILWQPAMWHVGTTVDIARV